MSTLRLRLRPLVGLAWWSLAVSILAAQQDWKATAVASFDDAWQTIADSFYDPTFGGLDWAAVKAELRPKAEAAGTPDEARQVITAMLARLKQSHFVLLSEPPPGDVAPLGDATIPIEIRVVGSTVLVTQVERASSADVAGIRAGQTLIAVDGRLMSTVLAGAQGSDPRRAAFDAWRRAFVALHGARGSTAVLRVRNPGGIEREVSVVRGDESGEVVTVGNLPPLHVRVGVREVLTPAKRRVGLIGFNYWLPSINGPVGAAMERFRTADGLVIDLRGNPGGLADMMRGISGYVFNEPATLGKMQTRQGLLEFRANPRRSTPDGRRVEPYGGPVAILVDELTASTSECFAAALQSLGRARIFGRPTMGQALPSVTRRLPSGDVLLYAIGDFVTGTGRRVEGEGITPDEIVPVSAEALAAGRDEPLDKGLVWVDRQRKSLDF